ncbi:MAG TPA: ABC transporter permease [Acidimicrobiales bacterium]|nr:ABC transporter permease [Acidimicrobiales bacterium]
MKLLIVSGMVFGGIYAISSLGLVLTYVSSRIFNFAQGALAFFIALLYYDLNTVRGWPALVAGLLAVGVAAPLLGLLLWAVLFRRLSDSPTTVQLVATIGLYVAVPPIGKMLFVDTEPVLPPGFFATPVPEYDVLGVTLNANQIAVFVCAVVVGLLLAAVLRYTTLGLTMRGVVDHRDLASVMGVNPAAVTAVAWMMGTTMAGLAGVLLTPVLGLNEVSFSVLLISSFAAVVVGRLRSLPWTFVGAIGLGLSQTLVTKVLPDSGYWARATRPSIPFVVMLVFLVIYGVVLHRRGTEAPATTPMLTRSPDQAARRRRTQVATWTVFGVLALVVPGTLTPYWLGVTASGVAVAIAMLSFVLVTGEGGMISLCQISFAGVGAMGAAQLTEFHGWDAGPAVFVAALVAVPFGILVALAGLRLGELYLALATLSFAVLADSALFTIDRIDNLHAGQPLPRPSVFGFRFDSDLSFFYLALGVFVIGAVVVANLRRSTTGMTLAAIRSSEVAARTIGVRTMRAKVATFGLSAFMAGVGGGLLASFSGRATPGSFNAIVGIVWLAVAVTWGVRSITGALLAGVAFSVFPALFSSYVSDSYAEVPTMLFGLGAIMVAREPRGIVTQTVEHWSHLFHKLRRSSAPATTGGPVDATVEAAA